MHAQWRELRLVADDVHSLSRVSDVMHDAFFSRSDISHDATEAVFRLNAWREVPELARRERFLLVLPRIRTPRVSTLLEFRAASEVRIAEKDSHGLDSYCLESISHNAREGLVRLVVMGPLEIEVKVDRLCGHLRDVGEPTWDAPDILTIG